MYDRGKRSIHAFSWNIIKIEIKGFFGKWEVSETSHFFFKEDDENRILEEIKNIEVQIVDKRKYGRATIIFLKLGIPRKG